MLTELYRRMTALLAEAGFTAWAADAVPPDAAFPFVTMEITPAGSMHALGRVVLTGWPGKTCSMARRLAMADALYAIVPSAGLKLPLENGLALLTRCSRAEMQWVESGGATGVRIPLELRVMGGDAHA